MIMRYDNVIYSLDTKLHCSKFVTHQVMTFEEFLDMFSSLSKGKNNK